MDSMGSIADLLLQRMGKDDLQHLSRQVGGDEASVGKALAAALPALLGAMSRNAASPEGASALDGALNRDHDGSILDDISGYLNRGGTRDGDGILEHVLGGKRGTVESAIGRATGLDAGSIAKLLPLLAPLVMGALGRMKREKQLEAEGVSDLLNGERQNAEQAGMGGFASLIDADGDGDIKDDLFGMATRMLGRFMK